MNFLAHLYLSGNDHQVMVGNFIGDFVRGRELEEKFGSGIARGVALHRAIDEYTDHHPTVRQSKDRLRPKYRHYAGVIVDIFYDHFLAAHWKVYSNEPLEEYAAKAYQLIIDRAEILPERVNQMLPYMMRGNWLVNYAQIEGIERVLGGMSRRTTFESKMEQATADLIENYDAFSKEFTIFFPDLQQHAKDWLNQSTT